MSNGLLRITLRRSPIGYEKSQGRTAVALGLGKLQSSVIQPDCAPIRGMIHKIAHLLEVEPYVEEGAAAAEPVVEKKRPVKKAEEAPVAEAPAEVATAPEAEEEAKKPVRRRTTKKAEEAPEAEEQEETK